MAANSDLAVWETFKEKREIFNHPATSRTLTPRGTELVLADRLRTAAAKGSDVPRGMRVLLQNSGATTPPNALDETVEVKSQALEPTLSGRRRRILSSTRFLRS